MDNKYVSKSHVGEVWGIYTLTDALNERNKYGLKLYKGVCIKCGYERIGSYSDFSAPSKITTTCKHISQNGNYRMFNSYVWENKRIGKIFRGMKKRCYSCEDEDYRWYGAKGIKVCDEWINNPKEFENWAISNGYSDELTIDRIDESKDYSPDNCRWITLNSNSKYKSTTSLIEVDNEVHTGREWSKILGLGENQINKYVKKNGIKNVEEFIRRYRINPALKPKRNQSYYDLYMNND